MSKAKRIQEFNDDLRIRNKGGRVVTTRAFAALPVETQMKAVEAMRAFSDFSPRNDPYQEHDCAVSTCEGETFVFKVSYDDLDCRYGSEDPSDPAVTARVLTLMLSSDM